MSKDIVLHFNSEAEAIEFKKVWDRFKSKKDGTITQAGKGCTIHYNNITDLGKASPRPNPMFRGCQHCG